MHQVEVAGSYYELGLNYGRIVAENKLNSWWQQPTEPKLASVKAYQRSGRPNCWRSSCVSSRVMQHSRA